MYKFLELQSGCVTARFSGEKKFCLKKCENAPKMGQKWVLFKFIEKFLLNFYYNENLYCLLYSCTNLIFGKFFFWDIGKMFSANQLAGFFNQSYLQNISKIAWFFCKLMKKVWLDIVKNGDGKSGHGSLKLAVSQEWIDRMNWFFACWHTFRKA